MQIWSAPSGGSLKYTDSISTGNMTLSNLMMIQ